MVNKYIDYEQQNTQFELKDRINSGKNTDIIVEFDANKLTQYSYNIITELSSVLESSEIEVGEFELDIFKVKVNKVKTYENELIHL